MRRSITFRSLLKCRNSVTDIDNNIYDVIIIGSKQWIVQNLRTTHYANGILIPLITATSSTYTDWFLPSRDELNALQESGVWSTAGLLSPPAHYWSSTEIDNTIAYHENNGPEIEKNTTNYVRAIRAFTSLVIYTVGDVGPTGGWIFYKNGNNYLECAPTDQSVSQVWSNIDNIEIGATAQGSAIGTGQANTTAIIGQVGHVTSAAKLCNDLSIVVGSGWAEDVTGAMCYYNNDIVNKAIYGGLYNWHAVNNVNGLCYFKKNGIHELGWRIASKADFDNLKTYLGGTNYEGGKLKETGFNHWTSPNYGATNITGFTGLPGGLRSTGPLNFYYLHDLGYFWSSDSYSTNFAWISRLEASTHMYSIYYTEKGTGYSVRCVRDIT